VRPGELCQLRPCDIDMTGAVWLFRPVQFKTRHRGQSRVVAIGPQAQKLLAEFTPKDSRDFYFSPRRTVAEFHAQRSAKRQTPRYPSHLAHNNARRVREPGSGRKAHYTTTGYGRAIARACERLHPLPVELQRQAGEKAGDWWMQLSEEQQAAVKAWRKRYHFHPNRIRHTHGTSVRHRFGLEAAQVALGHARADVTQVYAERNLGLAVKVAAEVG
jgi:integrase